MTNKFVLPAFAPSCLAWYDGSISTIEPSSRVLIGPKKRVQGGCQPKGELRAADSKHQQEHSSVQVATCNWKTVPGSPLSDT